MGGNWSNDERISQVQHLKHNSDKPAGDGIAKGNGTAGRVAHIERRVFINEGGLDFCRRQAMFRDMGCVAALVSRIIPIDQRISQVPAQPPDHRRIVF